MTAISDRAKERRVALRQALSTRYPHLLRQHLALPAVDGTAIVLGRDQNGDVVNVPRRARLEHSHVIGTTGGGKSKLLEHMFRQDVADGHGVLLVDPHGNHPDSLYRSALSWLYEKGYAESRVVHLIDPSASTHTVGFNTLARPDPETDLSVIAGVTLEAFSRAWGGEDTTEKPTIERILTVTFTTLADLGLTLAEAPLLYDREDRHGFRAWALKTVRDQYARDELSRLHELSLDERRRHDFDLEVIGPINRIARFIRPAAIRAMLGQSECVIDIRAALDEGHIILANLSGGSRVYERDADLLGRLLTRALFFHAKRRRNPERPFFIYLDECHRYLSGDLENILAEIRKYGCGVILSHQWLAQLEAESENMLAAIRNATNTKIIFRLKDPLEAEDLAHMVVPLDLEMPVRALIKPTVVGNRRVRFRSEGVSEEHSTSHTRTVAAGISEGEGYSHVESVAHSSATGESSAESWGSSLAEGLASSSLSGSGTSLSTGQHMLPDGTLMSMPTVVGLAQGQAANEHRANATSASSMKGESSARMRGRSTMRARTVGTADGYSTSVARHQSVSLGEGETRGTSRSHGEQEGLEPILESLPSAVHGKENILYMAAQTLRTLTTGRAFVNFVNASGMQAALLTVPNVQSVALPDNEFETIRATLLDRSPSAVDSDTAQAHVVDRQAKLLSRAAQDQPEQEPTAFRHKKRRASKQGT
jgi:Type IV secretion-system coupling protein DNA-binding domain/Helicase HerA, central domain